MGDFNRKLTLLLAGVFAIILGVVIFGEVLGLFDFLNERVPSLVGLAIVIAGGYPVFKNVIRAALHRQIISHTLMTLGVLAALAVGQWVTAALVVVFMRIGVTVERLTTESARRAVKELTSLAPQTARVEQMGVEMELPVAQVMVGDVVIVRPGQKIAVDGEVIGGQATGSAQSAHSRNLLISCHGGRRFLAGRVCRFHHRLGCTLS